jgi:hypothetical protein
MESKEENKSILANSSEGDLTIDFRAWTNTL